MLFFDGFSIIEAVKKSFTFGNRSLLKKVGENFNHARRKHNPSGTITQISKELIGLIMMKPISGSGALGMYSELAARVSVDSLIEKMGATIVGASETVFYTMAIYYGSQKIKKTGHTLICALLSLYQI